MGSSEKASSSTKQEHEHDYDLQEWAIEIADNEDMEFVHDCCIYKVGKSLRKIKEEAYSPQFISIGPYHQGCLELTVMEKQKLRYLKEFQRRIGKRMNIGEFLSIIKKQEDRIRGCYAESTAEIPSSKFTKLILHDAVFIMELFLRNHQIDKYYKQDILLTRSWVYYGIKQDLMLLENQLPYFLLDELYNLAFATIDNHDEDEDYPPFIYLTCEYFEEDPDEIPEREKIEHFTDLLRWVLIKACPQTWGTSGYLHCAAKLHEAGVKLKKSPSSCLLDVTFGKKELQIPQFIADGSMECIIRNVMALEQFHYPAETSVCSYIKLMGLLISTEQDVELLVEKKVIVHGLGHNGAVAKMFNKLCLEVTELHSCYHEIITDLNQHYESFWKRNWGNLRNVYFSDLWRGTATGAAAILLVLTLIQTVCSIIQVL